MRVVNFAFLTSSLAPGRDGVGDYTRQVSRALTATGHRCLLISLNDGEATDDGESWCGRVLRLSGAASWASRTERALAALREFQPDWVSLQFVCYGFHPKGLTFGLAAQFAPLFAVGRGHVMLHELWIGESDEYGLKDRVVGSLQKRGMLRLLRVLRPAVVHTSNPVYVELLRRNAVSARELPLPGNIPVVEPESGWLETTMRSNRLIGPESFARDDWWVAGVFGTIHPHWDAAQWIEQLCDLAREQRKRLLVLHLGYTPEAGAAAWKRLANDYAARGAFLALGAQSAERISTVLQNLDFGIATSPWTLIGKSGSVAALLDHGIPVMVPRDDWKLRRGPTPEPTSHPLLFRGEEFFRALRGGRLTRRKPEPRIRSIAEQMLRDLHQPGLPGSLGASPSQAPPATILAP